MLTNWTFCNQYPQVSTLRYWNNLIHSFILLVPSRVPSVFVTNVTSTSVKVHWNPLPQQYHNGYLLGYRVFFRKAANYPFPVDAGSVTVYNSSWVTLNYLEPGQRYEISVSAFTSKGDGPRSVGYSVITGSCDMKRLQLYNHDWLPKIRAPFKCRRWLFYKIEDQG